MLIETDIGHDPDDAFTLCYLAATGTPIEGILVTPGDRDQLALARFISEELGLNVPISAYKHSDKYSVGGAQKELLKKYNYTKSYSDKVTISATDLLVIGPPSHIGRHLEAKGQPPTRCTMQGGFLPYRLHQPLERLANFEGKDWVPTFNMNGDRKGTLAIIESDMERRFCGKNVCHTILLTKDKMANFKPKNRAAELFIELGYMLFNRHAEKKFHDPVAACCHLHPEIGTWVMGKPVKKESGWTTELCDNSYILADIDRDAFWERLYNFV